MKNVLVIGGTGFIGSHLVEKLCAKGYSVNVLARKNSNTSFLKSFNVNLRFGDLLDTESLKSALEGIDTVFCLVNVNPAGKTAQEYKEQLHTVHVDATANLVNACKAREIRRLVYLSSVSAMGYSKGISIYDESFTPDPVDDYGKAKLAAENILSNSFKNGQVDVTIMRPVGIFGERGPGPLAKVVFFVNKGFVPVLGSGRNLQSISYVGNIVNQAIFLANSDLSIGKTYIASDERPYSVNEIIEAIGKVMVRRYLKVHIPLWMVKSALCCVNAQLRENILAIATQRVFSGQAIFRELGYRQEFNFSASVARTIKWLQEKKNE